ncbi:MAG TPA: thioesterase family protein [Aeromicrobium sp.]|nr:thioesterase family protein [Aeromicrobium sp.]
MSDDFFATDTHSTGRPDGSGIRDLTITDRWNTPLQKPNGGYILAVMLRGLAEEVSAGGGSDEPMVASITYFKASVPGPAELHASVMRAGRRVQTGEAMLMQGDAKIAHLVASFGHKEGGHTQELGTPPALPDPDDCVDAWGDDGKPAMSIAERMDYRLAAVPGWVTGKPSGDPTAEVWIRLAGGRDADVFASALLVDAFPPPIFELGHAGSLTIQLTVHFHGTPAPGWIASRITTRHVLNGYNDEDCELWDSTGRLVAQSRQFAMLVTN